MRQKKNIFALSALILFFNLFQLLTCNIVAQAEEPEGNGNARALVLPTATNPKTVSTWVEFTSAVQDGSVDQINLTADITATANIVLANFPARNLTVIGSGGKSAINMAGYTMAMSVGQNSTLSFVNIDFTGTGTSAVINPTAANSANWIVNFQNVTMNASTNTKPLINLINGEVYFSGGTQLKLTNTQTMVTANKLEIEDAFDFVGANAAGTTTTNANLFTNSVANGSVKVSNSEFTVRTGNAGNIFTSTGAANSFTIDFSNVNSKITNARYFITGASTTTANFTKAPIEIGTSLGGVIYTAATTSPITTTFTNSPITGDSGASLTNVLYTNNATSSITADFVDSGINVDNLGSVVNASTTATSDAKVTFTNSAIKTKVSSGPVVAGGKVSAQFTKSSVTIGTNFTAPTFQVNRANSIGSVVEFKDSELSIAQSSTTDISTFYFNGQTNFNMDNSKLTAKVDGRFMDITPYAVASEVTLTNGTLWDVYSRQLQVINTGNGDTQSQNFKLKIDGATTKVNLSGNSTQTGGNGGIVSITGAGSEFRLTNGAELDIRSLTVGNATPTIMIQAVGGGFYVSGKSKLNVISMGDSNAYAATIRFRLVGEMIFDVSENSIVNIEKYGSAPGIRMYGGNNQVNVRSGSDFTVYNAGEGNPADPGGDTRNQGILFTSGSTNNSFNISGEDSNVSIIADKGAAIDGGNYPLSITAGQDTYFIARGKTASATAGIFSGGNVQIDFETMKYFDFANSRTNGGYVLRASNAASTLKSATSDLAVWKTAPGVNIYGNPSNSWIFVNYLLTRANFSTVDPTSSAIIQAQYLGADAYTRMNGNNQRAIVDDLRVPTNADKTIYGHVSIPEGKGEENRDAYDNEVQVSVEVKYPDGRVEMKTGTTYGEPLSIYGDAEISGTFAIPVDGFIPTGTEVKVVSAYRGAANAPADQRRDSLPQDILTSTVAAIDVTPPTKPVVTTDLNNATKQISGTSDEEGAKVFFKANGDWLKDSEDNLVTTTVLAGSWLINLPAYLENGTIVDVYLKDNTSISPLPAYVLPKTYTQEPDGVYGNLTVDVTGYDSYVGYHDAVKIGAVDQRFNSATRMTTKDILPDTPKAEKTVKAYREGVEVVNTQVGDTLVYQVTATNNKPATNNTLWKNVEIIDSIPVGTSFDPLDTGIKINNLEPAAGSYEYDPTGNGKLTVKVGDLATGQSATITFKVKVTQSAVGLNITNKAKATGESPRETPFVAGPENLLAEHETYWAETLAITNPGGIVFGVLEFVSAPTVIDFGAQTVKPKAQRINQPTSVQGDLTIQDSRASRRAWRLTARLTSPLSNGSETINGALRYVYKGSEITLNSGVQEVASQTNVDERPYKVNSTWSASGDGLKLQTDIGAVKASGKYTAVISWELTDAP